MDCAANWLGLLTQMLTEIFKVKRKNLRKVFQRRLVVHFRIWQVGRKKESLTSQNSKTYYLDFRKRFFEQIKFIKDILEQQQTPQPPPPPPTTQRRLHRKMRERERDQLNRSNMCSPSAFSSQPYKDSSHSFRFNTFFNSTKRTKQHPLLFPRMEEI